MNLRRTKIIATLGPATDAPETLAALLRVVDCVRLNFSHGVVEDHAKRVKMVRAEAELIGKDVAVFADLQGPKIRVGTFLDGEVVLEPGAPFSLDLDCDPHGGDVHRVWFD